MAEAYQYQLDYYLQHFSCKCRHSLYYVYFSANLNSVSASEWPVWFRFSCTSNQVLHALYIVVYLAQSSAKPHGWQVYIAYNFDSWLQSIMRVGEIAFK